MRPRRANFPVLLVCMALTGCSGTVQPETTALAPGQTAATLAAYTLNAEEQALDCKKLTGRMQVRILQVRDYEAHNTPSSASHVIQSAVVMAGSGATRGLNPSADHARDRAQLDAYNQRLAALNCKTFNLDDELRPKAITATPTPVAKPKDGSVTAQASGEQQSSVTIPVSQIGGKNSGTPTP